MFHAFILTEIKECVCVTSTVPSAQQDCFDNDHKLMPREKHKNRGIIYRGFPPST